jgi:hypothetical protein
MACKGGSAMMKILFGTIALVIIVGGAMAAPDLMRYMRIRAM